MEHYQEVFNSCGNIEFSKPTVVLASKSPRRIRMMEEAKIPFVKILSGVDDSDFNYDYLHENIKRADNKEYAREMALLKLKPYVGRIKNGAVVTSDTSVFCNGIILEKPITVEKCREQHKLISGKTNYVYTAIAVYYNGKIKSKVLCCKVKIKPLSDQLIEEICSEPETLDAAGYRIAGAIKNSIEILGDKDVVVGFSVGALLKILKSLRF